MIATENLNGLSGVYCAIHRDSLSCYVGSSVNMAVRRQSHLNAVAKGKSQNAFHRAVRKLGASEFDFEVLEKCSRDELRDREDFWIAFLGSAKNGGLNTCPTSAWKGLADVTKERISLALKGREHSAEHRANTGKALKALWASRPFPKKSEEQRRAISERNRARKGKFSAETLEKMRLANIGRKHTEETKRKVSEANKGKVRSAGARLNYSKSAMGRVNSPEARAKHSRLMTGKKHTAEHKLKIGLGSRRMWAAKRAAKANFKTLELASGGESTALLSVAAYQQQQRKVSQ